MPEVEYPARLTEQQKQTLLDIWNTEYPKQLCMPGINEFDAYLNSLTNPTYLLLRADDGEIIGWATLFTVETVRCFFIMLKSKMHGKGCGTLLLNALKAKESVLFGWAVDHNRDVKADGTPYPSPVDFYRKNGFTINNELRLETDILSAVNIHWQADA
ncbi:N-acetyltransferase [Mucilaginibacter conchicola]|uniref:N-acetyltransferase n=1 Tax=Mucilaginibacter conchicola TaxID=2303333 RepID=A0A372NU51_9SPHI|nr:GNAT family N-acetyltransferase [Mucilaginibacter conchicola]RFZ92800.1 N-acetyltransferase [Mucilaginibacter conchicola]